MAAVKHADDDLLTDVAPFGETDRVRLDARLERNRLLVHVAAEERDTRLDAQHLRIRLVELDGAGGDQRRLQCTGLGVFHVKIESRFACVHDTHDDHRAACPCAAKVAVLGIARSWSSDTPLTIAATLAAPPGPTTATCANVSVTSPSCTSSEKMN